MTTTRQDWVAPNEGEGVEGGAGCGVQRIEVMDASFFQRVSELSLGDGVRSSAIKEELGIQLLLLHIESSQLRWFRYLRIVSLWCLLGEMFQACRTRKEALDTLERFCLLAGLGTPRCPCRRSWMDRSLPSPPKTVICYTGQLANHLGSLHH